MPLPMAERPRRLLDVVDDFPLAGKLLDNARKTVRHHVLDEVVGPTIEERVDAVLGRVRKR
ncbi:MAG: hypothetical protein IVW52_05190 [Acidimicrobiales bacterium]|nr:hypothetical protein [Acidimicrobiales bacterium]